MSVVLSHSTKNPVDYMFINNIAREKQRQFVVWSIFFIYFLYLIEGALRKWLLPGLSGPLTLLRDPFVIALYIYCLFKRLIMRRGIASTWLSFAIFISCFGLIQYMSSGYSLMGWFLGVRSYWLYMPLAFIVAVTFQPKDIMSFLKFNLWISLPYAMLIANQYASGPKAFINHGVGGDDSGAVVLGYLDIVRPFGLFTYTFPNVQFTSAIVAIFLAIFLSRPKEQPNKIFFFAMSLAVATMSVLTGSRYIFFSVGIIIAFTLLSLIATRMNIKTLFRIFFILLFAALAGWILVQVFPDMLAAMEARIEIASRSEGSLWDRIYYSGFSFLDAFKTAPILGHGIGSGASGVVRFLGLPQLLYGEADTQRNINELGIIFGSIFLIMRWLTSLWLLITAIKLARKGLPIVLPLAGFAAFPIAVGQITNSTIIAFLPWLFLGIILSCNSMLISPPSHLQRIDL